MNELEIFTEALNHDSLTDRSAYLERACGTDAELKKRVEQLLHFHESGNALLDRQPAEMFRDVADMNVPRTSTPATPYAGVGAGTVLAGRYTLVEKIGEGGMGVVYRAQQTEPMQREVAVKLIKAGVDSKEVFQRFELERQALAVMDHPCIARVFDGGTTAYLQPYFVMEYVRGLPITEYCDQNKLTPGSRLELFVTVCQAVQHAHQKGIIHRDLKPSNVLVTEVDGKPMPKVIDFGVAKASDLCRRGETWSNGDLIVGTPQYMSPEQADPSSFDVDTRTDVYALGIILYEILVGSTPIDAKEFHRAAVFEMLRMVREVDPPRPSTRLSGSDILPKIAASRNTEPAKLTSLLRGELDWVVMKSLEKDRLRRYDSASDLAKDIQRYLVGESVLAVPASTGYRLRKFLSKNRGPVVAASLVFAALLAGISGTTLGMWRAERARANEAIQRGIADSEKVQAQQARDAEAVQRRIADSEKARAQQALADMLTDYRESTSDVIRELIRSRPQLGRAERIYLENTLKRWQAFADRQGEDQRTPIAGEAHFRVGQLLGKLGQREEAIAAYQKAIAILSEKNRQSGQEHDILNWLASTRSDLGKVLAQGGKPTEAQAEFERACELWSKLRELAPKNRQHRVNEATAHMNLAAVIDGERSRHEKLVALDIFNALWAEDPADIPVLIGLAGIHFNNGNDLSKQGQWKESFLEFETARKFQLRLTEIVPEDADYLQQLARIELECALKLTLMHQEPDAWVHFNNSRDRLQRLADFYPAIPDYRFDLAATRLAMGELFRSLQRLDEAVVEFQAVRDIQSKLAERFPANTKYRSMLAKAHGYLAKIYTSRKSWNAVQTEATAARDLFSRLAAEEPQKQFYQLELGQVYLDGGYAVLQSGKAEESLAWFQHSIALLNSYCASNSNDSFAKGALRASYFRRINALLILHRDAESLPDWDRFIELTPPAMQLAPRVDRASARAHAGRAVDAVADVEEILKSTKCSPFHYFMFARIFACASEQIADSKQLYADRAMEFLTKSIQGGYRYPYPLESERDFDSIRKRDDYKKLIMDKSPTQGPK